jgi:hypothetical protein
LWAGRASAAASAAEAILDGGEGEGQFVTGLRPFFYIYPASAAALRLHKERHDAFGRRAAGFNSYIRK